MMTVYPSITTVHGLGWDHRGLPAFSDTLKACQNCRCKWVFTVSSHSYYRVDIIYGKKLSLCISGVTVTSVILKAGSPVHPLVDLLSGMHCTT